MIKTVNINLGRTVFQIDEDAFDVLRQYLNSLNQYYKYTEGRDEIVSDIEDRLAELLTESLSRSGFDVVSLGDVDELIEIMGRPEDFDEEGERMETAESAQSSSSTDTGGTYTGNKRLYRNTDDSILSGVASGLSAYLGIQDPLWMRIAFIVSVFFSGIGLIAYIILWAILPKAETNAQKLEMRGKKVNINNLEKKIRNEINEAGQNLSNFASNQETYSGLRSIVHAIGKLFGAVAKLAWIFVKIILVIMFFGFLIGFIGMIISGLVSLLIGAPAALKYVFASSGVWFMGLSGGLLVFIIPLIFLIYLPFRIWGKHRVRNNSVRVGAIGLFVLGCVLSAIAIGQAVNYYSEAETVEEEIVVSTPFAGEVFELGMNDIEGYEEDWDDNVRIQGIYGFARKLLTSSDRIELDVVESNDENLYLEKVYHATGKSELKAEGHAKGIVYNAAIAGNSLTFDPYFKVGDKFKIRDQSVRLKLKVPEGAIVNFSDEMDYILDHAKNNLDASARQMVGHSWVMTDGVLTATDTTLTFSEDAYGSFSDERLETYYFSDFSEVSVTGGIEVEIVQGTEFEVYSTRGEKHLRAIEIEVDDSELSIHHDWDWRFNLWSRSSREWPKFYISMPELEGLDMQGACKATISGFDMEEVDVELSGACHANLEDVKAESADIEIVGASSIDIDGMIMYLNLEAVGASSFDGDELVVDRADVAMAGASSGSFKCIDKTKGSIVGASNLTVYAKDDAVTDVSTVGASDFDRRSF